MTVAQTPPATDTYTTLTGTITQLDERTSRQGHPYAYAVLHDAPGNVPIMVPPTPYRAYRPFIANDAVVTAAGRFTTEPAPGADPCHPHHQRCVYFQPAAIVPTLPFLDLDVLAGTTAGYAQPIAGLLLHACRRIDAGATVLDIGTEYTAAISRLLHHTGIVIRDTLAGRVTEHSAEFAAVQLACRLLELPPPLTWEYRHDHGMTPTITPAAGPEVPF